MNIYDIAKLANVSIATVSRVVNNSPKVSPKTKEKVLAVMKENEYTPNAFARGLGLGSMKTVGIICPNIDDIYMAKAVSYLERNLHAHGYDCILGCSGFKQEEKEDYVRLLLSKKIDTLIPYILLKRIERRGELFYESIYGQRFFTFNRNFKKVIS